MDNILESLLSSGLKFVNSSFLMYEELDLS